MLGALRKKLARRVVWGMNMHEGESLLVKGGIHAQDYIEEIAMTAMKQGVDTMVSTGSDEIVKRIYDEVPIRYLKKTPKISMKMVEAVDNYITLDERVDDPRIYEKIPHEKMAAARFGSEPLSRKMDRLGIKTCVLGYPTKKLASSLGVSYSLLRKIIFGGTLVDARGLMKKSAFLTKNLKNADLVHITDEFGTNLTLKIKGRPMLVDDSYISDEDFKRRDRHNNIPGGEVFMPPIETYGHGTLISPKRTDVFSNKMIENIKLVFEKGKLNLNKTTAEKNEKALKATIKNCMKIDRKRKNIIRTANVAELGIGLNPVINEIIGFLLTDEKIGGTVHVAIGKNNHFNGKSDSCLHWDFITNKGVSLEVIYPKKKEKMLIENGKCCY